MENIFNGIGNINLEENHIHLWKDFEDFTAENKIKEDLSISRCGCKLENVLETQYEKICQGCGLVLEENFITEGAEWIQYQEQSCSGIRCEVNDNFLFKSYNENTLISGRGKMSFLHNMVSKSCISSKDQALYRIKKDIDIITKKLKLSKKVSKDTMILYKRIKMNNIIFRGKKNLGILAVCFYYSCEKNYCNIIQKTIIESFKIDTKTFSKCYKYYSENIDKNIVNDVSKDTNSFVDKICIELGITEFKIQKLCKDIITVIDIMKILDDKCSQSIISSVIVFVSNELKLDVKIEQVCKVCYTSLVSINKISKILLINRVEILNRVKQMRQCK